MIPVASRMLSVPLKPGTNRWPATSPASGFATKISNPKQSSDDAGERGDRGLEPAKAALLEGEDRERSRPGDQRRGEERDPEQQVDPERGADDLGDVGRHRDQLRLQPETDRACGARGSRGRARAGCCPVAIPTFADWVWISIAIRFAATTTQSSR